MPTPHYIFSWSYKSLPLSNTYTLGYEDAAYKVIEKYMYTNAHTSTHLEQQPKNQAFFVIKTSESPLSGILFIFAVMSQKRVDGSYCSVLQKKKETGLSDLPKVA